MERRTRKEVITMRMMEDCSRSVDDWLGRPSKAYSNGDKASCGLGLCTPG